MNAPPYPQPSYAFATLAGVQVNYDRLPPPYDYGSTGKGSTDGRTGWTFYCQQVFAQKLDACFSDLWYACPLGKAEIITSAGAWVRKEGMHGKGRAFDLDGIFWGGEQTYRFVTQHAYEAGGRDRRVYLAVEAVLKQHFGVVLDYNYNRDHWSHFHIDDTDEPGFARDSRADLVFVQASLASVLAIPTRISGLYDDQTRDSLHKANVGDLRHQDEWRRFLTRIRGEGFKALAIPKEV